MKTLNNIILSLIRWIWQFPQNILALCLESVFYAVSYRENKFNNITLIVNNVLLWTLSLGDYMFIHRLSDIEDIKHEQGHHELSILLGPLYLVIIGIPRLLHYILYRVCNIFGITWKYNRFYTEIMADWFIPIK